MASFNQVQLIGHLGQDPKIKIFDSGGKIANFSLATQSNKKDPNGEWVKVPVWHNIQISLERSVGFVEKYVIKGDLVHIVGSLVTEKRETDENTTFFTKVVVQNSSHSIQKLNSSMEADINRRTVVKAHAVLTEKVNMDDEIPF